MHWNQYRLACWCSFLAMAPANCGFPGNASALHCQLWNSLRTVVSKRGEKMRRMSMGSQRRGVEWKERRHACSQAGDHGQQAQKIYNLSQLGVGRRAWTVTRSQKSSNVWQLQLLPMLCVQSVHSTRPAGSLCPCVKYQTPTLKAITLTLLLWLISRPITIVIQITIILIM
jgi:hypothetical protein